MPRRESTRQQAGQDRSPAGRPEVPVPPGLCGRCERRYRHVYVTALIGYWVTAGVVAAAAGAWLAVWLAGPGELPVWATVTGLLAIAVSGFDGRVASACAWLWSRHRHGTDRGGCGPEPGS